jgi:hypothetical protein
MRFVATALFALLIALPARAEDGVVVHLRADSDAVRIVRVDGDQPEQVCTGLCDKPLPRDAVYQLRGEGIPSTQRFTLGESGTDLTLRVDAGSSVQRTVGAATAVAGSLSLIVALGRAWLLSVYNIDNDHPVSIRNDRWFLGTLTPGLVLGVGGFVMLATSGTTVTTSRGVSFSALPGSRRGARRGRVTLTPTGLLF